MEAERSVFTGEIKHHLSNSVSNYDSLLGLLLLINSFLPIWHSSFPVMRVFKRWLKVCIWFGTRVKKKIFLWGSLQTRLNLQLKRNFVALKQTSVLCLIGAERKQSELQCQGASCLNLCQLICHHDPIDQRTSQPPHPAVHLSVRFTVNG